MSNYIQDLNGTKRNSGEGTLVLLIPNVVSTLIRFVQNYKSKQLDDFIKNDINHDEYLFTNVFNSASQFFLSYLKYRKLSN